MARVTQTVFAVQTTGLDFWSIFTIVTGIVTLLGGMLAWLAYVVSVRESEDDVHNKFEVFFNKFGAEGRYEPYQKMLGISIGEPESLAVDLDERPIVLIVDKVIVKQDQGLGYRLRRRLDPRANIKGELELQTRLNPNHVFEHWGVESVDHLDGRVLLWSKAYHTWQKQYRNGRCQLAISRLIHCRLTKLNYPCT